MAESFAKINKRLPRRQLVPNADYEYAKLVLRSTSVRISSANESIRLCYDITNTNFRQFISNYKYHANVLFVHTLAGSTKKKREKNEQK